MQGPVRALSEWIRRKPALARLALRLIPDWERQIHVSGLGPFVIRLRRNRSWWLRDPLQHERVMLGYLKHFIRPGDVCLDVGANIGLYTRFMVQQCGAGAVLAFEPMSENLRLLRANIALDAATKERTQIFQCALGAADGDEQLQVDDVMSESAVLDQITVGRPSQGRAQVGLLAKTETVKVRALESLAAEGKLDSARLIKVDVEGAELIVLEGGRRFLKEHHPILAIELHRLDSSRAVLGLLGELGYICYGYVGGAGNRTFRRVEPADLGDDRSIYDVHFLIASHDEGDFAKPIAPYGDTTEAPVQRR